MRACVRVSFACRLPGACTVCLRVPRYVGVLEGSCVWVAVPLTCCSGTSPYRSLSTAQQSQQCNTMQTNGATILWEKSGEQKPTTCTRKEHHDATYAHIHDATYAHKERTPRRHVRTQRSKPQEKQTIISKDKTKGHSKGYDNLQMVG